MSTKIDDVTNEDPVLKAVGINKSMAVKSGMYKPYDDLKLIQYKKHSTKFLRRGFSVVEGHNGCPD